MDLELTSEQGELTRVARAFLDQHSPSTVARAFLDGEEAHPLHREIGDLGWYGIGLEEDDPFGVAGLCVLAEEVGAHAAPTALIDVAVVARAVTGAGPAVRDRWLDAIVDGTLTVSLAALAPGATWHSIDAGVTAQERPDGQIVLTGAKTGVLHGTTADAFAVTATLNGRPAWFLVDARAPNVEVRPLTDLDAASAPARLTLDGALLAEDACIIDPGGDTLAAALAVGATASAAEAIGAAGRGLDLAREYSLERRQFGKPIAGFQAIRHLLADLHTLRETSRSTILYAAAALDEGLPDAIDASSIAKAHASRAARDVIEGALQVFGGVGFTWEHDLHLFHRRVLAASARFGDARHHERRLGDAFAAGAERMALATVDRGARL